MSLVPAITALPDAPSRQDPTNFDTEADAFLGALPTLATQLNAAIDAINTLGGDLFKATSSSSVAIGTGSKAFTLAETGRAFYVGAKVRVADGAAPSTNYMTGVVTAFSGTSLTVNVTAVGGSGTIASWVIGLDGSLPSLADIGAAPLAAIGAGFSAHKNGAAQTLTHAVVTKLTFGTEEWDTNAWYDTSTSRFTPLVAGKYLVTLQATLANSAANDRLSVRIYKNGSAHRTNYIRSTTTGDCPGCVLTVIVDMNGTTDYIEAYGQVALFANSGTQDIEGAVTNTYFQAVRV